MQDRQSCSAAVGTTGRTRLSLSGILIPPRTLCSAHEASRLPESVYPQAMSAIVNFGHKALVGVLVVISGIGLAQMTMQSSDIVSRYNASKVRWLAG